MTQQEQQEFMESLEAALSWMRAIQERLRANDNTQGPRDALEARLRETEKIHQSQHEGRVKMDMALVAAEILQQSNDEELKNHIQSKLKDLKSLWEETCTYIIHCHSRIEWVWLHWSEYLKACEEFELWLTRQRRSLDVRVELQLGVKEKLWQVDQQRVVVSDIHNQATLLERLLDEAAALHNRTHDPSVEPQAQERLQEAYNNVRDGAEERLSLLQKISEEHQTYQCCLQRFQSWLLSKTRELTDLMEREGAAENKLRALQALDDSVAGEEKTLQHIEGVAEALRANTSPAGAEVVVDEAEELRLGWQRLRQGLCEAEEGLRSSLDTHSQYVARCQRLGEDISRLRLLVHKLDQELEQSCETRDPSEEKMVGQWRKYTAVRNALAGEESQVELLKAQLKELFRFSEDSRHLSDDVLAVVREHQSVKCRVTKLCSESESGLRNVLQDPLLVYAQWGHMVSQILEASAEVTDFSHIAMLVQNIERLLKDSVQLQERLRLLQVKGDLLDSLFGPEGSDGLQDDLSAAIRTRELLHSQLLQRKNRLQGLISRTKDFADAYELTLSKLRHSQDRLLAADQPKPHILAKKSQCDQFRVIQKELEDCEAHILVLETLVCSSQNNRSQFERLHADWKHLHQAVSLKVRESEENIIEHESFHEHLKSLEKWLIIMRQKLESFLSPTGGWSLEGCQHEVQRALGEFPEKELQLQQMEAQGQEVLEKTSVEGQGYILRDMRSLQESWLALHSMSLHLHRLLNSSTEQKDTVDNTPRAEELSLGKGVSRTRVDSSRSQMGPQQSEAAVVSGASGPRRGGGLEGEAAQEETEQGGWPQSHRGPLILTEQHNAHVRPSRAGKAGSLSSGGGAGASRAEQRVDTPKGSSFGHSEEDGLRGGEGIMEAGGGRSPRGGAFNVVRRSPANQSSAAPMTQPMGGTGQSWSRRRAFEAWLSQQNELLAGVLATGSALPAKKLKKQQDTVKALRVGVSWGQDQFQLLLQESQGSETSSGLAEDVSLEELRYRWMLYKSKLKDVGEVRTSARTRTSAKRVQAKPEEPALTVTALKKPGLLQRVCRLALPLWLLLLALLLLASLLPLMDGGSSCSLSNNFARSFNIMLRYDGPPPT